MILVAPLHDLDEALSRRPSHLISLSSPGAEPVELPGDVKTLRLTFHDIVRPREDLIPARREDIVALVGFARGWPARRPMLIHCWAGVSRSPAAAYITACARSRPGGEQALADRLRTAAPFATPNARMVALADEILGRNGAMSAAVEAIGRGAETTIGRMFILDFEPPRGDCR
jgi:Predicted protein tyrosine phosphatase